jgi:hypothetical protein
VYDPKRNAPKKPSRSQGKIYAPRSSFTARRYKPFEDRTTGLFLIFADLNPSDRDRILAFANKYGLLGIGESIRLPVTLKADEWIEVVGGESHETWATEIQHMRWAIELWRMLRRNDPELARVIHWQGTKQVNYRRKFRDEEDFPVIYLDSNGERGPGSYSRVIAGPGPHQHNERLGLFKPGNLQTPGWYCLQDMINEKLKSSALPRLLWKDETRERRRLGLFFYPQNLLGCLWLQFAFSVEGGREYRKCVTCNKPFVLIPGEGRKDRQHCSRSCRTKKWLIEREKKQRQTQPPRRQKRTAA